MNVNALNSIHSMQKLSSTPAFKSCTCDKEPQKTTQKQNLSGLEALAAMLTPHKHYVQLDFNSADGKTFKLTSGISTIDDKEKEVVSSLQIDKKEGKTKTDIINSLLRDTTNLREFSMKLKDGAEVSVLALQGCGQKYVSTMTKDGETNVIHQFGFNEKGSTKTDVEAYKQAINLVISSIGSEKISSVTVATQK